MWMSPISVSVSEGRALRISNGIIVTCWLRRADVNRRPNTNFLGDFLRKATLKEYLITVANHGPISMGGQRPFGPGPDWRYGAAENCVLLGYYAANRGNFLLTFRETYRSHPQGSRIKDFKNLEPWRWNRWAVPKIRYEITTASCVIT